MEPTAKRAVLLGSRGEPEIELYFGYHDLHPVTKVPLRDWVKALPNRRWNPSAKSWRVGLAGLPKGTLRDAGFIVTFVDGSPAKPSDLRLFAMTAPEKNLRCQHGSAWPSTPTNGTAPSG